MPDRKDPSLNEPAPSAEDLRKTVVSSKMEEIQLREKVRVAEQKMLEDFAADFLGNDVSEEELAKVRRLVMTAVKKGAYEALVYSFPCRLCTDQGRAINNVAPNWPETLTGKAKQLYERFNANAKPKGYKLKATIISFPDGMPGDVGLFLNWAPDRV